MTTKNLIPRASGEGGIGITDVTWGYGYYDTGNFNKGLFVKGSGIEDVIANTVTQGGLGGEWTKAVNGLDIYYNGGNVGIGTTSSSEKLHIHTVAGQNIKLSKDNHGPSLMFKGIDSTNGLNYAIAIDPIDANSNRLVFHQTNDAQQIVRTSMVIDSAGNVGIGTTNPGASLHVNGNDFILGGGHLSSSPQNCLIIAPYGKGDNIGGGDLNVYAGRSTGTGAGGDITFLTSPAGVSSGDVVNAHISRLKITSAGNVGIGTTNPGAKLEITDLTGSPQLLINNSGTSFNAASIKFSSGGTGNPVSLIESGGTNSGKQGLFFSTGLETGSVSTQMVIDSTGNVGIGTTSPGDILDLTAAGHPTIFLNESTNSYQARIGIPSATGHIFSSNALVGTLAMRNDSGIQFGTSTPVLTINSSGNVGIGTTSSSEKLDIHTGSGQNIKLCKDNHGPSLMFKGIDSTNGLNYAIAIDPIDANSNRLVFHQTNDAQQIVRTSMVIDSAGNVGIGTTNPGAELDVVGKVYFSKIPCSNNLVPASNFIGAAMSFQPASSTFGTGKSKDIGLSWGSLHGAGGTGVGETDFLFGSINSSGNPQELMKLYSDGHVRIGRNSSENNQVGQQFYGALVPGGSLEIRTEQDTNASTAQLRIVGGSGLNGTGQAVTGSLYIDNGGPTNTVAKFKISQDIIGGEIHVVSANNGVKLTSGATAWTGISDETLKENISPLENVLDKIKDYRCVEYNLKESPEDKKIGFIAQDWVDDFNPIVDKDEEGLLGMKYTETMPVLLKAIQEQQQLIEDLRSEVEALKNK